MAASTGLIDGARGGGSILYGRDTRQGVIEPRFDTPAKRKGERMCCGLLCRGGGGDGDGENEVGVIAGQL